MQSQRNAVNRRQRGNLIQNYKKPVNKFQVPLIYLSNIENKAPHILSAVTYVKQQAQIPRLPLIGILCSLL